MSYTDDPQVHAHLGLVRVPAGSCCEGQLWEEYTPEAATTLIVELSTAIREATWQLANIKAACAQGHDWDAGYNSNWGGENVTIYHCTREGCQERREEPGWLPFEPKQHLIPFGSKLLDCTGPGCEWCADEDTARIFREHIDATVARLNDEFLPRLGDPVAAGLTFYAEPVLKAKKLGHVWHIDATPEQVQAALDARNGDQP